MSNTVDTIVAVATPPGRGGVGIVRVSGPAVRQVAGSLLGRLPEPRYALWSEFRDRDGTVIDNGLALYFPAPHSFTGEEVLELQGHGGPLVMDLLLQAVMACDVRLARPGEFTERAFLNDKIDLAQAEAIADLIDSTSVQAARSALRSLQGEFSRAIYGLLEQLTELRVYIESAIDFPDEEIDFLDSGQVAERLQGLQRQLEKIHRSAQQGCLQREGMTVVIAGPANAGKSSLMNVLARRETAIVTSVPGTTRDILREQIQLDGMPLHVIDTAGLRESMDPVEQIGIQRAHQEIEQADLVLLVFDDQDFTPEQLTAYQDKLPPGLPRLVIRNKIDLTHRRPAVTGGDTGQARQLLLSVQTGQGIDLLCDQLKRTAGYQSGEATSFIARRRHLDAIGRAEQAVARSSAQLDQGHAELVAEELRQAQQALGEITGDFSSEDLLGEIFSSFCIGK